MREKCWRHSMNQPDDEAVSTIHPPAPQAFKYWMCGSFLCYTHRNQCNVKRLNMVFVALVEIQFEIFTLKHLFGRSMAASNLSMNDFYWIYSPNPLKISNIWNVQMTWSIQSDARWHSCIFAAKWSISEFFSLNASSSSRLVTKSRHTILTCLLKCTNVQIS